MTLSRPQLSELLDRHGLAPSRALGQNFVADANTVRRIARLASVGPGSRVIEIGAGIGSLTLALVESGASVTAVEVDRRLVKVLTELVAGPGVEVVEADALELDWPRLTGGDPGWVVVGNLPYNMAVPLVVRVLEVAPAVERMLVLVQREVGERITAGVGNPAYGAVSVKVAYWAEARLVGSVPPTVFLPRPRVDSVLVSLVRRGRPLVDPAAVGYESMFELVAAGFRHRRKMLRRSLAGLVGTDAFDAARIRPDDRAEDLDVSEWGRLASCRQAGSGSESTSNRPLRS